jgi:hypothetical protein
MPHGDEDCLVEHARRYPDRFKGESAIYTGEIVYEAVTRR